MKEGVTNPREARSRKAKVVAFQCAFSAMVVGSRQEGRRASKSIRQHFDTEAAWAN